MPVIRRPRPRVVKRVNQLPVNPLKMPPPYWRSGGSVMHAMEALEELSTELLPDLGELIDETSEKLKPHYEKYPKLRDAQSDEAMEKYVEIVDDLAQREHKILLKTEVVNLMVAIFVEELVNMLCVFNLSREIVERIEQLSPADKLFLAARILKRRVRKDDAGVHGLKELMKWRNAFAHGHCVDRPTNTLRHNHLVAPEEDYRTVPKTVTQMLELLRGFLKTESLIRRCSANKYVRSGSVEVGGIRSMTEEIGRYKFSSMGLWYGVVREP